MEETSIPFDIICDPEQKLYKDLSIAPAFSMAKMASLKALEKIRKAKEENIVHGKYEGNELQLPAVFLIDKDQVILKAHYGSDVADLPSVDTMVEWLKGGECSGN